MIDYNNCKNCNETLVGQFCHQCGEKVVNETDFSIRTLSGQVVDGVFNIDAKIYKTFIYLLFKPGKLTSSYIEGIRKLFMKPIQIFLVTNILFFLLLTKADILRVPAKYFFNSGRQLNIEAKMADSNLSAAEVMQNYDRMSSDVSKSLVIFIVPVLALILWVLYYKTDIMFGEHLIFSMHYVSFFFIGCLISITVNQFGNQVLQIFIVGLNLVYLYFAMLQVYKNSKVMTFLKSICLLAAFIAVTFLYRTAVSYISFKFL